jgi:catechol 2,3-dioxygenase-like lactoylglutathione lyase family enzyme
MFTVCSKARLVKPHPRRGAGRHERQGGMQQRLSAVTLGVGDLDRSRAFYEALGWRRGNRHESVVFFQLNGTVLSLWSRQSLAEDASVSDAGARFGGIVLSYNTHSREEVDAVMAEAERAGATILRTARDAFWGGYYGHFADPDGHVWEVAWNPEWELDAEGFVRLPPAAPASGP